MLVLALVYFVLGYLAYGAIFAAIGALAPGNREAQQYSGFFGFFAVIPLMLQRAVPDATSSRARRWRWRSSRSTAPGRDAARAWARARRSRGISWGRRWSASCCRVILVTVAAGRIFRATLLLYGARPSIGTIVGALRTPR